MEQEELLQKIGRILEKLKIPYFITGGIAVAVWGRPRFTADIDLVVQLVPQKLDKLADALLKIDKDVYLDKKAMQEALRNQKEFNFIHPASGMKVDFWIFKNEPFERIRLKRRVAKKINNQKIYFISPEDLVISKLLWYKKSGSSRHLEDVESILKISKINLKYLKRWLEYFDVLPIIEKFLQ